ncbi:MAG: rmlC [Acidobacteria bacterium]|nr:rmlC [Acidobacteriota bacterium]
MSELTAAGLDPQVVQRSISNNRARGTLRGLHYQAAPHEENKLVSYGRGDISDFYHPESARGLHYDDPAFRIEWPSAPTVVSARDLVFPAYAEP